MNNAILLDEPCLEFGYGENLEDPRLGLTMFGPFEKRAGEIRIGVVGSRKGLVLFNEFLNYLKYPAQFASKIDIARPPFLGFANIFGINILNNIYEIPIMDSEIIDILSFDNVFERTYKLSELYKNKILEFKNVSEETSIDVWFVLVSQDIKKHCSPLSQTRPNLNIKYKRSTFWSYSKSKKIMSSFGLFRDDDYKQCYIYDYYPNFHHQLKAKLLQHYICSQLIREELLVDILTPAVTNPNFEGKAKEEIEKEIAKEETKKDRIINYKHYILWQISSAISYKLGNRPWKLAEIREGVCYVGLVYKKYDNISDYGNAVCAAQMFLDNGDGVVFKSNGKPYYNKKSKEYHLKKEDASELVTQALESYKSIHNNYPNEIFIHSKVRFNLTEWEGFKAVCPQETKIVGITIKESSSIKLYRSEKYPIPRGTAWAINNKKGFLWTKGFIPRIHTANSIEVPNPLEIEISSGESNLKIVMEDIFKLTKLNYNACLFGDGVPITLKFSDYVGEILTSIPSVEKMPPLHFKYYL